MSQEQVTQSAARRKPGWFLWIATAAYAAIITASWFTKVDLPPKYYIIGNIWLVGAILRDVILAQYRDSAK